MVPRLRKAPEVTVTPVSLMPPRSNISVVVPLPSWNYNPLKPFDESYFERAVDTILSEEAELEAPQEMDKTPEEDLERILQAEMNSAPEEEMDQAPQEELDEASEEEMDQAPEEEMGTPDIHSPFGYDGTPVSTKPASHQRPKSHQSQKSQRKPPSCPTSSTSHPRSVVAPDYEDPSIFASVGGEKRLEVLKAIAKMPFMLKQPLRRSERLTLTKDIRDCATDAGLEDYNVDNLLDYVRRVYFDTHQILVTVDNACTFGDEINDLVEAPTEHSNRKRRNSVFNVDEVDIHNEPKKRKKNERRLSKTTLRSHKGTQLDDSTVIMTSLRSENENDAQVNGYIQVDEPLADESEADEADELQADEANEAEAAEPLADEPEVDEIQADESEADESEADEPVVAEPQADEIQVDESETDEPQVDESQVDEPCVDESPENSRLNPHETPTNTTQAGPDKSADTIEVIDLVESDKDDSHSRRNTSSPRPIENDHPVKTSSKKQSKKSEKRHSKTKRRSHKALSSDSIAIINDLETPKVTKARENSYSRADSHGPAVLSSRKQSINPQPHDRDMLSSRRKPTHTQLHGRTVLSSRKKLTNAELHDRQVLSARRKSTNTTQENIHRQAKPHGDKIVSSRRTSTNTPQASSGKSSHLIDSIEPASNDVSHSRRSSSPQSPRENGHPVKASKKRKSSHAKFQNGPENDPNQTRKDKKKRKCARRAEEKRRASMGGLKQPEGTVDTVDTAQEPILPSIPDEILTRRAKKRHRENMGDLKPPVEPVGDDAQEPILPSIPQQDLIRRAGKKRGGSMSGLKLPEDAVDAVAQEPILPSTPKQNSTRPTDGKRRATTVDPVAQGSILPSTPRRMVTESPKRHSPFPPLPADPTKWELDFF